MNERTIKGSIPDAPTFGAPRKRSLPGIECPDPSTYLDKSGASSGDIPKQQPRRKKRKSSNNRGPLTKSRIEEDRERADALQAALLLVRGEVGQANAFDITQSTSQRVDNTAFIQEVDNARLQQQQQLR